MRSLLLTSSQTYPPQTGLIMLWYLIGSKTLRNATQNEGLPKLKQNSVSVSMSYATQTRAHSKRLEVELNKSAFTCTYKPERWPQLRSSSWDASCYSSDSLLLPLIISSIVMMQTQFERYRSRAHCSEV
jgi:hypothetical protein